jgi:hypothetical protein
MGIFFLDMSGTRRELSSRSSNKNGFLFLRN